MESFALAAYAHRMSATTSYVSRVIIAVSLGIAAIAVLFLARAVIEVLLLIFGGVLFGIFLHGITSAIAPAGKIWQRLTLVGVVTVFTGLLVWMFAYGVPNFADQLNDLGAALDDAGKKVRAQIEKHRWLEDAIDSTPAMPELLGGADGAFDSVRRILSSAFGGVANVAIVLAIGFFCAWSPHLYKRGLTKLAPPRHRGATEETLTTLGERLWWWTLARLLSMAVIGVSVSIGLWFLNVPMPIILGVIAALLTFIPNLGAVLAVIPPMLLAFEDGTSKMLSVLILYVVLQVIESNVITPLIMKKAIELPPALLLSAQAILAVSTGIIGLAFAAPLTAAAMVLVQELYVKRMESNKV